MAKKKDFLGNIKRNNLFLPIALIAIVALIIFAQQKQQTTEEKVVLKPLDFGEVKDFKDTFYATKEIDNKYGTNMSKEMLNFYMLNIDLISNATNDLNELKKLVENSTPSVTPEENRTKTRMIRFVDARIEMLESERQFQLAEATGSKGDMADGFECKDAPYIINATIFLNESIKHGIMATKLLDVAMTGSEEAQALVGVRENRPDFYFSPFRKIEQKLNKNIITLNKYCGAK